MRDNYLPLHAREDWQIPRICGASDLPIRTERKGAMLAGKGPADRNREPVAPSLLAGDWQIPRICGASDLSIRRERSG
ncbi:hypothetical protein QUF80_14455 [Desulfococcaceae bacterium HSG8]|nr:hypothetical protein [Desulfococcaceae bacterium HSG8]